jgi:ADP-ribose pyrophosphatase YjhB (NUDIX family)
MTKPRIRPLALVVFRREDGCWLLNESYDSVKKQTFYRPLGGGIEFGERAVDAARREIREEIGAEIVDLRLLKIFENIFTYEDRPGHAIIFMFEAKFADAAFSRKEAIEGELHKGEPIRARWLPLSHFENPGAPPLYPEGLLELLRGAW